MTTNYIEIDRTLGPVLELHAQEGQSFVELQNRLQAAEGDLEAAKRAFLDSTDDEEVIKLKTVLEQAQAKLDEIASSRVQAETLSEDEKTKLKTELEEMRERFRVGHKSILSLAESMKDTVDVERIKQALEEMGDPTRSGRGRKPGTPGTTGPKASATVFLQSSAGSAREKFETFGQAAKRLNISTQDLQRAFAKAAGVEFDEIASVDRAVSFTMGPAQGDPFKLPGSSVDWNVSTEPKQRKKPGPKPGGQHAAPAVATA